MKLKNNQQAKSKTKIGDCIHPYLKSILTFPYLSIFWSTFSLLISTII